MMKITRAVSVAVALVAATPFAADAEPMMLTDSEMEAVTAAALVEVNIPINLNVAVTTQVANAIALAFATCAVCTDSSLAVASFASAGNLADTVQNAQQ